MRDVIVDLRAVRRHLDSGAVSGALSASATSAATGVASSTPPVVSRRIPVAAIAATVIAIAAAVVLWSYFPRREGAVTSSGGKPSIAVMYFQNNTGNAQFDWLKTGLTDMLVTDLSQSADVEVLSTDRLYQILRELNRHNDPVLSFETVQQVARRAGVDSVLVGNYVKAGETIRINVTLQDTADGRILSSERVDATGESNLFPTVDDLTRRLRSSFALPVTKTANRTLIDPPGAAGSSGVFRSLSEVTTSSAEAYRFYAQGIDLHQRGREEEAVPLFEKALAIDPDFALALTKLAVVENNIGHWTRRDEFAKRALEKADRLPARERYYIEGFYYSHSDQTVGKAIDAYKKAIELYPDHQSASHNLALMHRIWTGQPMRFRFTSGCVNGRTRSRSRFRIWRPHTAGRAEVRKGTPGARRNDPPRSGQCHGIPSAGGLSRRVAQVRRGRGHARQKRCDRWPDSRVRPDTMELAHADRARG